MCAGKTVDLTESRRRNYLLIDVLRFDCGQEFVEALIESQVAESGVATIDE